MLYWLPSHIIGKINLSNSLKIILITYCWFWLRQPFTVARLLKQKKWILEIRFLSLCLFIHLRCLIRFCSRILYQMTCSHGRLCCLWKHFAAHRRNHGAVLPHRILAFITSCIFFILIIIMFMLIFVCSLPISLHNSSITHSFVAAVRNFSKRE